MPQFIKFYFNSSMLNMFRTLIHPLSGACDFSIVSPHWSCVLVSMCVGVSVWMGWGGNHVAGWSRLNMFRTLIHPSSGACDFPIVSPHLVVCSCFDVCWSFGVVGLGWYPCGRPKQAQHVSGINTSIIRSLRLFYCITTLVVCSCSDVCWSFGVSLPRGYHHNQPHRNSNTHRNKHTQPMWWYNRKVASSWWWMY